MKFKRKHFFSRSDRSRPAKPRRFRRLRLRKVRVAIPRIPIRTMAPNLVTMAAAAFGIFAILLAQHVSLLDRTGGARVHWYDYWSAPLVSLFVSGVCDFCDGGVARLLKATSKIGAELDSLADFVDFGVAPALVLYYWTFPRLSELPANTWLRFPFVLAMIAIFYAMCCMFRLARFNTLLAEPTAPRWQRYFMGVPAPGGAYLLLTPLLLWVGIVEKNPGHPAFDAFLRHPYLGVFLFLVVGFLMVSKVPTFALKHFHASRRFLAGAAVALFAGFFLLGFCETVGIVGLAYFFSLPFFAALGMRLPDETEEETPPPAAP